MRCEHHRCLRLSDYIYILSDRIYAICVDNQRAFYRLNQVVDDVTGITPGPEAVPQQDRGRPLRFL